MLYSTHSRGDGVSEYKRPEVSRWPGRPDPRPVATVGCVGVPWLRGAEGLPLRLDTEIHPFDWVEYDGSELSGDRGAEVRYDQRL